MGSEVWPRYPVSPQTVADRPGNSDVAVAVTEHTRQAAYITRFPAAKWPSYP
ncbi:MAG: hypothetical protein AAFN94_01525 [Pseudomonadota bacterium]